MNLIDGKMLTIFTKPEAAKKGKQAKEAKKIKLGIRLIFDDGQRIEVDGQTYVGRGTMVFYHNRYRTIKVHTPKRPTYYRSGSVIMDENGPVWVDGENASKQTGGVSPEKFLAQNGAWGVKIIEMLRRIEAEDEAESQARKAA